MFKVNDKVVCISRFETSLPAPQVGTVYVVERLALGRYPGGEIDYGLILVGFRHIWFKKRFRKLSDIKAENTAKHAELARLTCPTINTHS
jgi:hypothetical protein